jgi:4-amino-4-deoxy-L-arabinose transferase-like glycosyltransferase
LIQRRAVWLIVGFALARLVMAATLGLGRDEAYTLVASRSLTLSYFDHPPLHQWITHFTANFFGETVWVRLPFVALFALTGWLFFLLSRALYDDKAAIVALFALNVAPFFFASAGSWIVPDGPLLAALALAALGLSHIFFSAPSGRRVWALWLCVGAAFGLAGLSKYSAILTALGVLGFIATSSSHRLWLRRPEPYVAGLLALVIVSPVFFWNEAHGWVSFRFQGARGAPSNGGGSGAVLAMVLGEAAYLLPWIFAALIVAAIEALRGDEPRSRLLLWLALPPIVVFTVTPFWGDRGLPHWTMPGWFFLFPLLGKSALASRLNVRGWALGSAMFLAIIAVLAVTQARLGWVQALAGRNLPDPTLESLDWSALRSVPALAGPPDFVATTKWWESGKVGVALGRETPIFVFSDDPRGIAFLNNSAKFVGRDAVIIAERRRLGWIESTLAPYFTSVDPPQTLSLGRGGRDEEELVLVPAHGLTRPFPVPYPLGGR